ncbi:MAG: hypothetical protein KQJ78_15740 [Deltaproteobacteria bacterium]|nr:hypothetical protein [Deltaproteobacteria bacterium]
MNQIAAGRVAGLFQGGVFQELNPHPGAVFLCARGARNGRPLIVIASDPEPPAEPPDLAGSLSRVLHALAEAGEAACPVVFLFDAPALFNSGQTAFQGAGAELLLGREGVGRLYYELGRLGQRVPVVGAVFGALAQAQAFPAGMCRALAMLPEASLTVARPDAVRALLGEETTYQEMGGAKVHFRQTGLCDYLAPDEPAALAWLGRLLDYLPAAGQAPPPAAPGRRDPMAAPLAEVIPERLDLPFAAHEVVAALVDQDSFLELGAGHAREVVTGLARFAGRPAALVVSNPRINGAMMFPASCRKLARFIGFADLCRLPLVFLADAPGFMIGAMVEQAGSVEAGAALFEAIARATSPRLAVVLRRAYTAGLYALGGAGFAPAALWALPGASIGVYGPEAVDRLLEKLDLPPEKENALRQKMAEDGSLEGLLARGLLDAVIPPANLRREIARFLGPGL